jgi:dynein heavy chain, axonemal
MSASDVLMRSCVDMSMRCWFEPFKFTLQERATSEVETIRSRYRASVVSVTQLAEKDIQELRTYANPPPTIAQVLSAICTILGFPTDWESALMLLNHSTVPFIDRMTQFDIATVRAGRLAQLRAMFSDGQLDPLRVRTVSRAAHSLVLWVHAVDSYGRVDDIRDQEHRALLSALDEAATKQAWLCLKLDHAALIHFVASWRFF